MADRVLSYVEALREAQQQMLAEFPNLVILGLGVPDPGGVFGSTKDLHRSFPSRVFDLPLSEEANAGVANGMALTGMRVINVHQRVDFLLVCMNQIINHAAKWRFMFGSSAPLPVVWRAVIGRGWGQGAQHSQSLQSMFAHVPGITVVMPSTPHDAKGLLISAVRTGQPALILEHRNLYALKGPVPETPYATPFGKARLVREGRHATAVAVSQMVAEAEKAAEILDQSGISLEVIDARSVRPLDEDAILGSVRKTGALVACDTSWAFCGFSAELAALCAEKAFGALKAPVARVALPPIPTTSGPVLEAAYYPNALTIAAAVRRILGRRGEAPGVTVANERAQRDSW